MYTWNIDIIEKNKIRLLNNNNRHAKIILDNYDFIYDFIEGNPVNSIEYCNKSDEYFLSIAKTENENMKKSNILNSNIFQQLLNQKERKYNCNSIIINHDYSENQVIESIDLFIKKIFTSDPNLVSNLTMNKEILLKKDYFEKGIYIKDSINQNNYIGVISPNIEFMSYILVHELGHYIQEKKDLKELANNETFPFLLELYYYKFLNKKNENNTFLQKRYITDINYELSLLKTYFDIYNSNSDDYKIERLKEQSKMGPLLYFHETTFYCLGKYKAIDCFRKTKNIIKNIDDTLIKNSKIRTLEQFVNSTSQDVFCNENEEIVKKLVK